MTQATSSVGFGITSAEPELEILDGEVISDSWDEEPSNVIQLHPTPDEPAREAPQLSAETLEGIREEFRAAVADVEFRLAQQYELKLRETRGGGIPDKVYVEDMVMGQARITGYLMTSNSPVAGSIAWSSLHVVLMGVDYTITDGNTPNKYAWFIKPASGTTASLTTGNTLPTLSPNDALIFVNLGGTVVSATETSIPAAVMNGTITQQSLATDVAGILTNLQNNDIAQQQALDGAITSYYQNDPPWPAGAPSPSGGNVNMGDVWYDSNDGGAFRWTGAGGSPANTWQRIADTDTSSLAAKVNTKVTTYINATTPTAPTEGFTAGDLWIDTANGNVTKRWSGSAWVTVQLGNAAISAVDAGKLTTGTLALAVIPTLDVSTKTSGTLAATRVGAGVNGAVLTTATGTIANSQLGTSAVQPKNLNLPTHMIY